MPCRHAGAGVPPRSFCTRKVEMTGCLMPCVTRGERDIVAISRTFSSWLVAGHLPGTRPRRAEGSVKMFNTS